MRGPTIRFVALSVLVLLGAPVAMHVVLHDLHDHHAGHRDEAMIDVGDHSDHEHPIVSSAAPQTPGLTRSTQPFAAAALPEPRQWTRMVADGRNVIAHGAILATDDDVGLHALLSTYLI